MAQHTVKQGDCIMSIAEDCGFFWETLWNHPDNAQLKTLRKDPNILFPGDVVTIPDKTVKFENKPTDQRARFLKKNPRVQVRLRLLDIERRPRAEAQYTANIDGTTSEGKSDADGYITLVVPPNAQELKLEVTEGTRINEYVLPLGSIDPIDSRASTSRIAVSISSGVSFISHGRVRARPPRRSWLDILGIIVQLAPAALCRILVATITPVGRAGALPGPARPRGGRAHILPLREARIPFLLLLVPAGLQQTPGALRYSGGG